MPRPMKYYLYTLKFSTPVHFGDIGSNMHDSGLTCSADTFFSALCAEARLCFSDYLEGFVAKVKNGSIALSSLFPYYLVPADEDNDDELQLYLPKPLLHNEEDYQTLKPFTEMKVIMQWRKKMENTQFVRASHLKAYLAAKKHNSAYEYELPLFAEKMTSEKVNCRIEQPQPYTVSGYRFTERSGLYFIAGFKDDSDNELLQKMTESLGYSGIGGRRSSGMGKFELLQEPYEIQKQYAYYEDEKELAIALADETSRFQMSIAPIIPAESELSFLGNEDKMYSYQLLKRSGFVYSADMDCNLKRNTIYLIAEGSCFNHRMMGMMPNFTYEGLNHAVYRNGMGMFVGLGHE